VGVGDALGAGDAPGVTAGEGDGVGTGSWAKALRLKSRITVANSNDVANKRLVNERVANKRAHLDIS